MFRVQKPYFLTSLLLRSKYKVLNVRSRSADLTTRRPETRCKKYNRKNTCEFPSIRDIHSFQISLTRFPFPAWLDDKSFTSLSSFIPLLYVYGYLLFVIRYVRRIIQDKHSRVKVKNVSEDEA